MFCWRVALGPSSQFVSKESSSIYCNGLKEGRPRPRDPLRGAVIHRIYLFIYLLYLKYTVFVKSECLVDRLEVGTIADGIC